MNALVVVPTYNERDNLRPLVDGVLAHAGTRMLVIDDRSPAGTGEVADALAPEAAGRPAGARYLPGVSVVNWPLRRIVLSAFANHYVRAVTRLSVRDCTSGFRCWRREALGRLPLAHVSSEGYSFLVEMLYLADRIGCPAGGTP